MTTNIEKIKLRRKLEKYEGKIPRIYLNYKDYVAICIGHLLTTLTKAQILAFKTSKNKPASNAEIKIDFETVKKQPVDRFASSYKKYTKLSLTNAEIDKLTTEHIETFEKELKKLYSSFGTFPSDARVALFDMIFNLGITKLKSRFPKFNKAIKVKDWQIAAEALNP